LQAGGITGLSIAQRLRDGARLVVALQAAGAVA
jgi:hypothetical protein